MKVSVSLPEPDVEFLDAYAEAHAISSRSAAVQHAIRALRREQLPESYGRAWEEWDAAGEDSVWEQAVGDGLR